MAIWWALQTVTTVGYGDIVPNTDVGRVIGGIEMVLGISFITFLTAGVTSTVIRRGNAAGGGGEAPAGRAERRDVVDALVETRAAIADLEQQLDQIESKLPG